MIEQFRKWYENRHEYQKSYRGSTNKKIVGYFCTYVPEELFYAAKILPVRILGSHEPQDVTEPHMFGMYCPFCRDVLAQGLKGRYDYLDGIVYSQSCLHLRGAYMSWDIHKNPGWSYYLPMPEHVQSRRALPFLVEEYKALKMRLENWIGHEITDDDLREGIKIVNGARQVMKKIYELRKWELPPITGTESMYMAVSSVLVHKEEFIQIAEKVLEQLPGRKLNRDPGKRVMLVGSENDDIEYLKLAESLGCTIVIEEHCTTTRSFWNEVDMSIEDPLSAIALRYVTRIPCPTKDWPERSRFQRVLKFAKEWNVDGVICTQQKFCDPHECDIPHLRKFLEENGFPTLFLEFDTTTSPGQLLMTTEAFLETLEVEG